MNRVYAFAGGIVTAGVAASLFAGNPNPPAGPIGPTMVTLDELAGLVASQSPKPWKSRVISIPAPVTFPIAPRQVFTGPGVVRSMSVITYSSSTGATGGVWYLYDAASIDDLSTKIGAFVASNGTGSNQNAALNLESTVEKGLVIVPVTAADVTVVFRED